MARVAEGGPDIADLASEPGFQIGGQAEECVSMVQSRRPAVLRSLAQMLPISSSSAWRVSTATARGQAPVALGS